MFVKEESRIVNENVTETASCQTKICFCSEAKHQINKLHIFVNLNGIKRCGFVFLWKQDRFKLVLLVLRLGLKYFNVNKQ